MRRAPGRRPLALGMRADLTELRPGLSCAVAAEALWDDAMIRHIGRRLLLAIPTLLAVFTIIFIIVRVAPGDPAVAALGDYASADAVAALRERMGLNEPLWKQYLTFLGDLTRGDLGRSLISQKPVSEQIAFVLPYTLELTAAAILIGLVLGIPTGVITAIRRNTAVDYVGRMLSLLGLSFPSFYLGILLMFFFAVQAGSLPCRRVGAVLRARSQSALPRAPRADAGADRDGLHRAHDPLGHLDDPDR